jgi:transcriptional regulator ATRX
MGSTRN